MTNVSNELKQIEASWETVYQRISSNLSAAKPQLDQFGLTLDGIDELIKTLSYWSKQVDAPEGFSPGFKLGLAASKSHLAAMQSALNQLNQQPNQYAQLPTFINHLGSAISAVHTMAVFSNKNFDEKEHQNARMSAELSQSLQLLNTAQEALSTKKELLAGSQVLVDQIEADHTKVTELSELVRQRHNETIENASNAAIAKAEVQSILDSATQNQSTFTQTLTQHENAFHAKVQEYRSDYDSLITEQKESYENLIAEQTERYDELLESHNKKYEALLKSSQELKQNLADMTAELQRLQGKCVEQEKVIDSILPKGASAGLAAAFSERGKNLESSKSTWLWLFVLALAVLTAFSFSMLYLAIPAETTFLEHVLSRIPLAAPAIWLAWFSAIQYGNIIRVQEDYAFKEATSKAFQGYKDHMEHLGNVNMDEAKTALTLLSETTINVLGKEPLRIYNKSSQDSSPAHSLFGQLMRKETPHQKNNTDKSE